MKNLMLSGIAAAALFAIVVTSFGGAAREKGLAAEQPAEPKKPTVMQRKLTHAQKVLEGLALADFAKIAKSADELTECVREASWMAVGTPKYKLYSNDFIRDLEGLKKAAKDKNIDAAALAYVDLTLTCVKCHQHVREEKIGAAPALDVRSFASK